MCVFFCQAEDGIRDLVRSRGLGDVYKRQGSACVAEGVFDGGPVRSEVFRVGTSRPGIQVGDDRWRGAQEHDPGPEGHPSDLVLSLIHI
mgnify:CR=1 FL=1